MSNTPVIFAFYTSIIASIIYAFFGSCRRLSYGVFSLVSAIYMGMIIARVSAATKNTPPDYIGVMGVFTFMVGAFSAIAGILRLGSFVRFVPYEVLSGFRAGLYILVFSLQLNSIFGIDMMVQRDLGEGRQLLSLPRLYWWKLYPHLKNHINWYAVGTSVACMALMAVFRLVNVFWYRLVGQRGTLVKNLIRLLPVEFILIAAGFLVHRYREEWVVKYHLPLVSNLGNENQR